MWFMFFFLSINISANTFSKYNCAEKIEKIASEWKAKGPWELHSTNGLEKGFLASTTDKFGEWVLVRNLTDGAVLSKAESMGRTEVKLSLPDCRSEVKHYTHDKSAPGVHQDQLISEFISKNKNGVIYNWSPRMVLSIQGLKEIKAAASKLKLPLLILMDKDASEKELEAHPRVAKEDMKKIDSFDFKMRNVGLHYPAILVFKDKKIVSKVKYGFEKAPRYQLDLANMLK